MTIAANRDKERPNIEFSYLFRQRSEHGRICLGCLLEHEKGFIGHKEHVPTSDLFSYAIERGWANENPVGKVKKLKASASIGILTPEEFAKVLEAGATPRFPTGSWVALRPAPGRNRAPRTPYDTDSPAITSRSSMIRQSWRSSSATPTRNCSIVITAS
jgi:hypothetical protein